MSGMAFAEFNEWLTIEMTESLLAVSPHGLREVSPASDEAELGISSYGYTESWVRAVVHGRDLEAAAAGIHDEFLKRTYGPVDPQLRRRYASLSDTAKGGLRATVRTAVATAGKILMKLQEDEPNAVAEAEARTVAESARVARAEAAVTGFGWFVGKNRRELRASKEFLAEELERLAWLRDHSAGRESVSISLVRRFGHDVVYPAEAATAGSPTIDVSVHRVPDGFAPATGARDADTAVGVSSAARAAAERSRTINEGTDHGV